MIKKTVVFLIFVLFISIFLFSCVKKDDTPIDDVIESHSGNLMINGYYGDQYSVVYTEEFKPYAEKLAKFLSKLNGEEIPLAEEGKQTSKYAFKFIKYEIEDSKVLDYNYKIVDGNVLFYVALKDAETAVDKFIENHTPSEESELYTIRIDEPYVELLTENGFSGFEFVGIQTFENISDGVDYYCYKYKDSDGFPVKAHIVIAKKGSVSVEVGIPNAVDGKVDGHEQRVSDQVKSAEKKYGYDILAACNGSFFYMNKDPNSYPTGVTIKNGIVVSSEDGYYDTFAVMKDGTYYIGDYRNLNYGDVWQMLSGHYIPVKDGHIVLQEDDGMHFYEQVEDRYPRTAIGLREDGTLVMVVIDGRQLKVSMGATMYDLGAILLSLGCNRAINLDGGGSSTLYTNVVKNSPSDKSERKVGNSVFFVKNEEYNK